MIFLDQPSAGENRLPFDLDDRGLLLADGVFDTSLVLNGRIVFAAAHRSRLLHDAARLGLTVSEPAIEKAIKGTLNDTSQGVLRLTLTRGAGGRGLLGKSSGEASIIAKLATLDATRFFAPIKATFTSIRRNETSPTSSHKTLSYLDNVLAAREVHEGGANEALFLNTRDSLACGASTNLFLIHGKTISTPRLEDGALPGTLRAWVLSNAEACGATPEERELSMDDLASADAAFATNSLRLIAPLSNYGNPDLSLVQDLSDHLVSCLKQDGFALPKGMTEND